MSLPLGKPLAASLCLICSRAPFDDAFSEQMRVCYEIGTAAEVKSRASRCALCSACDAHIESIMSSLTDGDGGKRRYQGWLDIPETIIVRLCSRQTLYWGILDPEDGSDDADWLPARLPFEVYIGPITLVELFKPSQYEDREPWCEKPPHMILQQREVAWGGHLEIPIGTDKALYLNDGHLETMMKAAEMCRRKHTLCGGGDDTEEVKKKDGTAEGLVFRLIDVDDRIVRLADQSEDYVCISYMWGDSHRLSRLSVFDDGDAKGGGGSFDPSMPRSLPDKLPQTLEDVLWVVRSLGLRNVWIDAYCIDQGNQAEAELAFANMDSVYERAALTICPFWVDSDAGLHGVSRPFTDHHARPVGDQYISWHYKDEHPLDAEIAGTPWHGRGWIYQESLLSRQRLCFLPSSVYLTCCEQELSSHYRVRPAPPGTISPSRRSNMTDTSIKGFLSSRAWDMETYGAVVAGYSPRKLSFQTDALNALRGILSVLTRRTGMEFAYALPRGDLLNGVLWTRILALHSREENPWFNKGRVGFFRRPGFPTWSWLGYRTGARYELQLRLTETDDKSNNTAAPARGCLHWADLNDNKTDVEVLKLAEISVDGPGQTPSTPLTIVSEAVANATLMRWPAKNRPNMPELQWRLDVPVDMYCKLTRDSNHASLLIDDGLFDSLRPEGGSESDSNSNNMGLKLRARLILLAHVRCLTEAKKVSPVSKFSQDTRPRPSTMYEVGDVVLAMVVSPLQGDNCFERVGILAVPYEYWVQGGPTPCEDHIY